jgi:hypothetical protein
MDLDEQAAVAAVAEAGDWQSLEWRLDNLYWIVNKDGEAQKFRLNAQQRRFVRALRPRNLVLKARQLGFSTLVQLIQLDQALFCTTHTGVTIADTLPNAGKLFAKIRFAYERLPEMVQLAFPLASMSTDGLTVGHVDDSGAPAESTISIGVSARGGTVRLLHISELAKIALKFPARAQEINTGAIEAVPRDGCIIIESTAEGAFGLFWDLCEPAIKRAEAGTPETALDWRLHFFPWYECADYRLTDSDTALVEVPPELRKYFNGLEAKLGITLDAAQRAWYVKTRERLGKKMGQEYPSTPREAFEQQIEGAVYGDQMTWLRTHGRLVDALPIDPNFPVNTFWDFGVNDANVIWFHQYIGKQHRWSYYIEGSGKGLKHWWSDVCEPHRARHGYRWGRHFLPHDADAEILGESVTTKRRILEGLGMGVGGGGQIVVVPRIANLSTGIEKTRQALQGNHWFDKRTADPENGSDMGCGQGIKALDGYQYAWDEKRGVWSAEPLHNWASHGADGWRQFAQGWTDHALGGGPNGGGLDEFKARRRRSI